MNATKNRTLKVETHALRGWVLWTAIALLMNLPTSPAQDLAQGPAAGGAAASPAAAIPGAPAGFNDLADKALLAMKQRAEELKIKGVAMVAYAPGDTIQTWSSKMVVVGSMKSTPNSSFEKGNNLLGIAYSKAAEMADTLKNSGTAGRAPLTGEYGWEGGVVARGKAGFLIVAFSGGASAQDVQVSRAGLAILSSQL
jgi:hypothetical protein